jgi:Ammonium Transporter Family
LLELISASLKVFLFLFSHRSLSGLVAVTSGCAVVEPWAAIVVGVVAGWIYIFADFLLLQAKVDDAVSAIQVHLANGLWGVIATGLLASPDRLLATYGINSHPGFVYQPYSSNQLPAQLAGALFILVWTLFTTLPFFVFLDQLGLFRVNALEELVGLDATYQNETQSEGEDDNYDENEELRLAAYRQRFSERKKARERRKTDVSVEEILHQSWGKCDLGATQSDESNEYGSRSVTGPDVTVSEEAPPFVRKLGGDVVRVYC